MSKPERPPAAPPPVPTSTDSGAGQTKQWSSSESAPSSSVEADAETLPNPTATKGLPSTLPPQTEVWSLPSEAGGSRAASAPVATPSLVDAATQRPPGPLDFDLVGTTLKHFRIDKRLAAGGMGEVFLGFDVSLSRPVAIKTIRPELASDRTFLARFVREATAQANVAHPHVVQVYYVGEDRGVWFLAMQLVDGGSLHSIVSGGKKMNWQDAARAMADVCGGLVVAERLKIVHRDIKPANILLDRDGRAMLSDFGLAAPTGATARDPSSSMPAPRAPTGSDLQLATVTQVGVVMGTPEYVAPEQLKIGGVDSRADQFGLAATFYHLLTGKPALDVPTLPQAIAAYDKGHRATPVRALRPQVPRAFADVIDRCLDPDPSRRYKDAQALLDALRRAGAQPVVPASPALRALVWLLDVAPFVAVTLETFRMWPWLGPALFLVAGLIGNVLLGSSPGIWMMRLRLRTKNDGDVSWLRGFARFLVQHGWYVPAALGLSALYGASDLDVVLIVAAIWLGVSVLGSAGALFGKRQTLHDLVTGTRVLVDVKG